MHIVPIFNSSGNVASEIEIDDELEYVSGRVYKGKNHYYKGVGISYKFHHLPADKITSEYLFHRDCNIFYLGMQVSKYVFESKTGIFQERYQPFFPDFIGTCSGKEGTIVLNSETFKLSSVQVHDIVQYDKENDQAYYILDYKCERKRYLKDNGNPQKLFQLLKHMIENDWNFLWDKNSVGDITPSGEVSDVADLFVSDTLEHKFGTIYSLLYSMGKTSFKKYQELILFCNLIHLDETDYVFNAIKLLEKFGVSTNIITPFENNVANYQHAVLNFLITGKNCAYCSCDLYKSNGEAVRDVYIRNTTKLFSISPSSNG